VSEERVAQNLPVRGLRADLTPDDVADTLWALASPGVYLLSCRGVWVSDELGIDP
jgi:hypothetical protein